MSRRGAWMKKGLFFTVAALLSAVFALAGCDLLPFGWDAGERFEKDGLDRVFEAMAAKNYTIERKLSDDASSDVRYILENAIVEVARVDETKTTMYWYYDTTHLETMPDGASAVASVMIIVRYGGANIGHHPWATNSIQDLYDYYGRAEITTYDWEYDEAEKLYRHDGDTLQIDGSHVTVTYEYKNNDSDPIYDAYILKKFGVTEYDLSVFS